jgi:hypothetical protein
LRYLEVRTRRWLIMAGVCGGLSILVKVIGAYYVAGVLLFLAYFEQSESIAAIPEHDRPKNEWPYRIFSVGAQLLFLVVLILLLRARLGPAEFYQFVLPCVAVVGLVLFGERNVRAGVGRRFAALLRVVIPFLCGLAAPLIIFLLPYARSGAIGRLFSGVTSSVLTRSIALGVIRPAPVEKCIYALALIGLVTAAIGWRKLEGKLGGAVVAAGMAVLLAKASASSEIVLGVWYSAATLTPLVVLLGAWVLLASQKSTAQKPSGITTLQRQRLMLLLSLAAVCSLVQYPFAAPYYLCYTLPLTLLAATAVVAATRRQSGAYALAAIAGFYFFFAVMILVPSNMYEILVHKVEPMDELHLQRAGGLRIEYAANFADLIHFLQQHSPNGQMYAGNDCPELYFLSGLKNVTGDDGGVSPAEVLQALRSGDLKLVVINEAPFFPSARMSPAVRAELARQFPHSSQMGIFHVFWRE